ncbi:MAG: outer membrane beta-barrel protein [Spirochaetota bacterium]|nr:outer membrane beta-barrel protein [Spirochaetota bacterium]
MKALTVLLIACLILSFQQFAVSQDYEDDAPDINQRITEKKKRIREMKRNLRYRKSDIQAEEDELRELERQNSGEEYDKEPVNDKRPPREQKSQSDSPKQPVLIAGFKSTLPVTFVARGGSNLNFLNSFATNNNGGVGLGLGFYLEVNPIRFLAIETGIYWRTFELGAWDVSYSEYQIPLVAKFKSRVNKKFSFAFGAGVSYFNQYKGSLDIPGSEPGQDAISLPPADLRDGFSVIARAEMDFTLGDNTFLRLDFGYERAVRSLDITSHDFVFSLGTGFKLF